MSTVKEWLHQIGDVERQAADLLQSATRFYDAALRTGSGIVLAAAKNTGKRSSRIEEAIVNKCDLELKAADCLEKLFHLRADAMSVINQVKDIDNRDILEMHYITGWTLVAIAAEMGCTVRWVQIRHGQGLQEVARILGNMPDVVSEYQINIE